MYEVAYGRAKAFPMPDLTVFPAGAEARRIIASWCSNLEWRTLDLNWLTEPGSLQVLFDRPALLLCTEEVGGRCQVRLAAGQPPDQGYFGDRHLSFVPAGAPVHIQARGIRTARFAAFLFGDSDLAALPSEARSPLRETPPRLMFQDPILLEAALLVVEHGTVAGKDAYGAAIAQVLVTALATALDVEPITGTRAFNGPGLQAVTDHLLDHIDSSVPMVDLARIARLPVDHLGSEFARMTGMSVKHWLVDARVRLAQRLMLDPTVTSLLEVAKLAGFADQSHLSRSFRTILGQTPSRWWRDRR